MSLAILQFTLPEEQVEFRNACDASRAFCALIEIAEMIRKLRKYGEGTDKATIDQIRNMLTESFPDLDER